MEELQSEDLFEGAGIGRFNARGVYFPVPGEGGKDEREIADKYRKWADALRSTHPSIVSHLLTPLVERYEKLGEDQDNRDEERLRNKYR